MGDLSIGQQADGEMPGPFDGGMPRPWVFDETHKLAHRLGEVVLFDIIRDLKGRASGLSTFSHGMEEIFTISDRISVLRDGSLAARDKPPTPMRKRWNS